MTMWRGLSLALCAAALVACGGGVTAVPVSTGGPATGGDGPGLTPAAQENQVVLEFDITGDARPDMVTVDANTSPFTVVAVLETTGAGPRNDVTEAFEGAPIDAAVSEALSDYLANSFELNQQTRLDVFDINGAPVTVTIFE